MSKLPIKVLEGIFYTRSGALCVQNPSDGADLKVLDVLQPLAGKDVILSASHLPPEKSPTHLTAPGFGSCLSGPACKAGHVEDPASLWSRTLKGVLTLTSEGNICVAGEPLEAYRFLVGHYGRLAACASLSEVNLDRSFDDLHREAGELAGILQALQTHVKRAGDT